MTQTADDVVHTVTIEATPPPRVIRWARSVSRGVLRFAWLRYLLLPAILVTFLLIGFRLVPGYRGRMAISRR